MYSELTTDFLSLVKQGRRKRRSRVNIRLITAVVVAISEAAELWEVVGWTVRMEGDISYLK